MTDKKCNQCGRRINPLTAKNAGLISASTYNEFEINPALSYCELKRTMISDRDTCGQWISWKEYEGENNYMQ